MRDHQAAPKLPSALLFDMDGTLTRPMLDFDAIKSEMGIGTRPILEALAEMPPEKRGIAEQILHRHEDRAAEESMLNGGCDELIAWIRKQKLHTALITRNSRKSVAAVLQRHGLAFDFLITREDGKFKPDPAPLLLACTQLGIRPAEAWMIGDGWYDIAAGVRAGVKTVWVSHRRKRDFPDIPWQTVPGLRELLELLRTCV